MKITFQGKRIVTVKFQDNFKYSQVTVNYAEISFQVTPAKEVQRHLQGLALAQDFSPQAVLSTASTLSPFQLFLTTIKDKLSTGLHPLITRRISAAPILAIIPIFKEGMVSLNSLIKGRRVPTSPLLLPLPILPCLLLWLSTQDKRVRDKSTDKIYTRFKTMNLSIKITSRIFCSNPFDLEIPI